MIGGSVVQLHWRALRLSKAPSLHAAPRALHWWLPCFTGWMGQMQRSRFPTGTNTYTLFSRVTELLPVNLIIDKMSRWAVLTNRLVPDFFHLSRGTQQGCSSSPLFFTIFLEPLILANRANVAIRGVHAGGREQVISICWQHLSSINDNT